MSRAAVCLLPWQHPHSSSRHKTLHTTFALCIQASPHPSPPPARQDPANTSLPSTPLGLQIALTNAAVVNITIDGPAPQNARQVCFTRCQHYFEPGGRFSWPTPTTSTIAGAWGAPPKHVQQPPDLETPTGTASTQQAGVTPLALPPLRAESCATATHPHALLPPPFCRCMPLPWVPALLTSRCWGAAPAAACCSRRPTW